MEALAELQFYSSRPFAPTRRLALGSHRLPVDPAPGPGGILLGALVARYAAELDDEAVENLGVLRLQVQEGQRIVQPRLRHRFQEDRVGLTRSRVRLERRGTDLHLAVDNHGTGLQAILAAVYTAGTLGHAGRRAAMDAIGKGARWTGGPDAALFAHLAGRGGTTPWRAEIYEDPVRWALQTLGMVGDEHTDLLPDRKAVQRRFRDALRSAHPDHGATVDGAAARIDELTEARRILLS